MIARAKGRHFLVYNGAERVAFDQRPKDRLRGAGDSVRHRGSED